MSKKRKRILLIVGILIICFGFAIMDANKEERAENVAEELVETAALLPENEGKLIILAGTPELRETDDIIDRDAGLTAQGAVMQYLRDPLMKVYVMTKEHVVVDYGENLSSTADDKTEYWEIVSESWLDANRQWEDVFINGLFRSSEFDAFGNYYPTGRFENPPPVAMDAYRIYRDLYIGDFKVDYSDMIKYVETERRGFTPAELEEIRAKYEQDIGSSFGIVKDITGLYALSTGDDVGDLKVRITYTLVNGTEPVTLVGRQRGDRLVLEEDDIVSKAEQVQAGIISREEFLSAITKEDKGSRYIGVGFIVLGAALVALSLNAGKRKKLRHDQ